MTGFFIWMSVGTVGFTAAMAYCIAKTPHQK